MADRYVPDPQARWFLENAHATDPNQPYFSPESQRIIDRTARGLGSAAGADNLAPGASFPTGGGPAIDRGSVRVPGAELANIMRVIADLRAAGELHLADEIMRAAIQLGASDALAVLGPRGGYGAGTPLDWGAFGDEAGRRGSFGVDPLGLAAQDGIRHGYGRTDWGDGAATRSPARASESVGSRFERWVQGRVSSLLGGASSGGGPRSGGGTDSPSGSSADAGRGAGRGADGGTGTNDSKVYFNAWNDELDRATAAGDTAAVDELLSRDTDGDGVRDWEEFGIDGTDPLDADSVNPDNPSANPTPQEPANPDAGPTGSAALARALLPGHLSQAHGRSAAATSYGPGGWLGPDFLSERGTGASLTGQVGGLADEPSAHPLDASLNRLLRGPLRAGPGGRPMASLVASLIVRLARMPR